MNSGTALVRHSGSDQTPAIVYQPVEWAEDEAGGFTLDVSELRAFLFRQRYWMIGSVVLCLLLALVATMFMTPVYRATATVQLEPNVPILEEGQEAVETPLTLQNMQQFLQGQVDVLKSRNLANRVATALNLHGNERFLTAVDIKPSSISGAQALRERVIGELQSNLKVDLPMGSWTAQISFDSSDPAVSAAVANAYAENLITGNMDRRFQASSYARNFLAKELELAKRRLEASERSTLAYARSAQIVNTGGGGGSSSSSGSGSEGNDSGSTPAGPSLSASNLVQMNSALAAARTARINAEQRWRTAAGTPIMSLPEVISNGTVASLQAERSRLQAQLGKLRQTYKDDYPDVARVKAEIASVDAQINSIANQIRNSIRGQFEVAARQESAIASRMGGLKSETLREQDSRVQYDILNREAATNREVYDGLLQRYREVSTAAGVANNNISILDLAVPPGSPIKPQPLGNMVLGLVAGLTLGLLLAFIRERLDNTLRSPEDVITRLKQPLLGTTPAVAFSDVHAQLENTRSGLSEAYHSIRSAIEFSGAAGVPRSLLITSSRAGEGKSTTAIAVANDFAKNGQKVLLVDADLRLPSLHKSLQVTNEKGFVNVITGRCKLHEAAHAHNGFAFLSSGPIPPNPTELLAPHHINRFLHEALAAYDLIIFDGPPVMGLADSPQMARNIEATVLVAEAGKANRGHVKTAIRRLRAANANLIGVVLTKFSAKSAGYGDDYGYYYYYGSSDEPKKLGG